MASSSLVEKKYIFKFIFSFRRSHVEAKRSVDVRHSARNASRIRRKLENGVHNTSFLCLTLLCARYSVKLDLLTHIFALVSRQIAASSLPPFNKQCLQNSAESEERSVLTLGSLCCVRD